LERNCRNGPEMAFYIRISHMKFNAISEKTVLSKTFTVEVDLLDIKKETDLSLTKTRLDKPDDPLRRKEEIVKKIAENQLEKYIDELNAKVKSNSYKKASVPFIRKSSDLEYQIVLPAKNLKGENQKIRKIKIQILKGTGFKSDIFFLFSPTGNHLLKIPPAPITTIDEFFDIYYKEHQGAELFQKHGTTTIAPNVNSQLFDIVRIKEKRSFPDNSVSKEAIIKLLGEKLDLKVAGLNLKDSLFKTWPSNSHVVTFRSNLSDNDIRNILSKHEVCYEAIEKIITQKIENYDGFRLPIHVIEKLIIQLVKSYSRYHKYLKIKLDDYQTFILVTSVIENKFLKNYIQSLANENIFKEKCKEIIGENLNILTDSFQIGYQFTAIQEKAEAQLQVSVVKVIEGMKMMLDSFKNRIKIYLDKRTSFQIYESDYYNLFDLILYEKKFNEKITFKGSEKGKIDVLHFLRVSDLEKADLVFELNEFLPNLFKKYHKELEKYFDLIELEAERRIFLETLTDRKKISENILMNLVYAYKEHVYYGDFKPDNFFMVDDHSCGLTDFETLRTFSEIASKLGGSLKHAPLSSFFDSAQLSLIYSPAFNHIAQHLHDWFGILTTLYFVAKNDDLFSKAPQTLLNFHRTLVSNNQKNYPLSFLKSQNKKFWEAADEDFNNKILNDKMTINKLDQLSLNLSEEIKTLFKLIYARIFIMRSLKCGKELKKMGYLSLDTFLNPIVYIKSNEMFIDKYKKNPNAVKKNKLFHDGILALKELTKVKQYLETKDQKYQKITSINNLPECISFMYNTIKNGLLNSA